MSLYHMYVAAFGPPEAVIFRGTHLLFALTLVFLLYPDPTPPARAAWRIARRACCSSPAGRFVLHIFVNYEYFINRIIYIDDLTGLGQVLRRGRGGARARGDAARDRLGAADHRARVPGLRDALHAA